MKKKPVCLIAGIFYLLGSFSCTKDSSQLLSHDPQIYITTNHWPNSLPFIKYYIDSNSTIFNEGYNYANSIIAIGNDVYISGNELTPENNGDTLIHAKYWKNNIPVILGDETNWTQSYAMAIDNNDIYIAGQDMGKAVYWKNGVEFNINLGQENVDAYATGIAISGSDIFICGTINDSPDIQKAFCIKNDVPLTIQNSSGAKVNGMFVDGQDVYVCGALVNTSTSSQQAVYWKNGNSIKLEDASFYSEATGIVVSNGQAYVCGNVYGKWGFCSAVSWFSGASHPLLINGQNTFAQSIAVIGTDVYVAGAELEMGLESYRAVYWKGVIPYLLGPDDEESGASSIFLKK